MERERINNPLMEYYRHVYAFSKRWNGSQSLGGKTVLVYCEQGFGDVIQFARYANPLKQMGCRVILHAPVELHPILRHVPGVDECLDKQCSVLPKHDFHILSLSLPFLLGINKIDSRPYVVYPRTEDVDVEGVKIGIAWEGSPEHPKNLDRCCPLKHFASLGGNLFMLQKEIHLPELVEGVDFDLYGTEKKDFGDTAALINAMDFVVTVDTSVLHLAGAMGKKTYGILGPDPDPRWELCNWYDSVTLMREDWETALRSI